MLTLLAFIMATLRLFLAKKKNTVGRKRSFGDHVFKNPARCILNKISPLALLSRAFSCFQRP